MPHAAGNAQDVVTALWVDNSHLVFTGDLVANNIDSVRAVDVTGTPPTATELVPTATPTEVQDIYSARLDYDQQGRIYFTGDTVTDGHYQLYRVDLDGQNFEVVPGTTLPNPAGDAGVGAFGLNAARDTLAFAADAAQSNVDQIFLMPLSTATAVRIDTLAPVTTLSQGPTASEPLLFSPDGRRLLFAADYTLATGELNTARAVFVVATNGSSTVRLTGVPTNSNLNAYDLRWSPDGSTAFFRSDYVSDNDNGLYATSDLTTADQAPGSIIVVSPPPGGDVYGMFMPR